MDAVLETEEDRNYSYKTSVRLMTGIFESFRHVWPREKDGF